MLLLITFEAFNYLSIWINALFGQETILAFILYGVVANIVILLLKIVISISSEFLIERKFGFAAQPLIKLLLRQLKYHEIDIVFGGGLFILTFWFYKASELNWWWLAGIVFVVGKLLIDFEIVFSAIDNKKHMAIEGPIKESIVEIANRNNMKTPRLFKGKIDSIACTGGIGKSKFIIVSEDLFSQLSESEMISVIAHEMAHIKNRDFEKSSLKVSIIVFLAFWGMAQAINYQEFYDAFNAGEASLAKTLILFELFYGVIMFWFTPLNNFFYRIKEYRADRFSLQNVNDKEAVITALTKMSKQDYWDLSHLLYYFFYSTHPEPQKRIAAIKKLIG